jgi:hypothetical protein
MPRIAKFFLCRRPKTHLGGSEGVPQNSFPSLEMCSVSPAQQSQEDTWFCSNLLLPFVLIKSQFPSGKASIWSIWIGLNGLNHIPIPIASSIWNHDIHDKQSQTMLNHLFWSNQIPSQHTSMRLGSCFGLCSNCSNTLLQVVAAYMGEHNLFISH